MTFSHNSKPNCCTFSLRSTIYFNVEAEYSDSSEVKDCYKSSARRGPRARSEGP